MSILMKLFKVICLELLIYITKILNFKLKGLRKIYKLVGLNTISRLTNSQESLEVAIDMFKVILSNINQPTDDDSQQPQNGNGDGSSSDEQGSDDGQGGSSNEGMSDDEFNELSYTTLISGEISGELSNYYVTE